MKCETKENVMSELLENHKKIESREYALACCITAIKKINRELGDVRKALSEVRSSPVPNMDEVRRLSSDEAKLERDLKSEELYEKEKFEEIRILKMKHYDIQQRYVEAHTGARIYKFPPLENL